MSRSFTEIARLCTFVRSRPGGIKTNRPLFEGPRSHCKRRPLLPPGRPINLPRIEDCIGRQCRHHPAVIKPQRRPIGRHRDRHRVGLIIDGHNQNGRLDPKLRGEVPRVRMIIVHGEKDDRVPRRNKFTDPSSLPQCRLRRSDRKRRRDRASVRLRKRPVNATDNGISNSRVLSSRPTMAGARIPCRTVAAGRTGPQ